MAIKTVHTGKEFRCFGNYGWYAVARAVPFRSILTKTHSHEKRILFSFGIRLPGDIHSAADHRFFLRHISGYQGDHAVVLEDQYHCRQSANADPIAAGFTFSI
jgi:hypothetical protein